jgi:cytochrome c biogenesis protein CcdA
MKFAFNYLVGFWAGCLCVAVAHGATDARVPLDFFFAPGCAECERVEREIFPQLESAFHDRYALVRHDLTQEETIPLLLAYQARCHNADNGRTSVVVDRTVFLSGYEALATGLCAHVQVALDRRQRPGWTPAPPPETDACAAHATAAARVRTFTWPVVVIGGFLDGINPCAISTLIFFMSVLLIAKADRRKRLLVGTSFIAASFIVYTGLGLGFLWLFRSLPQFARVQRLFEIVLALALIPLAVLSLRDAWRFHRSGRAADVTLQLPKRIKTRISAVLTARLGVGGSVLGGFTAGAAVTLLESVCTGQSYVPVLTYLLKDEPQTASVWGLLLVYNLFFVLPLTLVFVCFHVGVQLTSLIDWSKRNLVIVKLLLAVFFAAMAALLFMR